MTDREVGYIGTGEYMIYYKLFDNEYSIRKFIGVCENFNTSYSGVSAFYNKEEEIMLLVPFRDIIVMYPMKWMK